MRILVLEDDREVRSTVVLYLEAAGYAVDWAENLAMASERMDVNRYDAWVLDRLVSDGDAISLLRTRRQSGNLTPALFLTAVDTIGDRVDGLGVGADDYLVKPFAVEELVARIHVLTRRTVSATDPVLTLADVSLDPTGLTAVRAGRNLGLTTKEFAILRYLVANRERVVTRTDLIEHCWNEYMEPMSNVVDVKIAQVRKKLGPPPLVHTVRGAGYLASAETPQPRN